MLTESESVPYASFGRRFAARLIDLLILAGVIALAVFTGQILIAKGIWVPSADGENLEGSFRALGIGSKLMVFSAFCLTDGLVYSALFEASAWQATFGKRLLNVYVTGDDRSRITIGRSFGRSLARLFAGWFGGSLVSAVLVAASKDRKAIHDLVANTLVLKGDPATAGALDTWRIVLSLGSLFLSVLATAFLAL